ncbi:MAG TPA: TonB-dependent receptor [Vicinamibacterales bacterium]|nr:TonB-dependent receptor [Vicinamibacterales bacterium]
MTALLHRLAPAIAGAVCVFALSCAFAPPGYAQTAAAGDVSGTVRDSTGGVLPGATLVLVNIETGVERTSVTNETGRFRIPAVPAGAYTLTVSLDGFATVQRAGLTLEVGQVLAVDAALPPAGVSQEVTVTADAPVIEPGRTQTGAVVSRTEIENLPSNGRDFLSFSTQVAGVTGQQMSGQGSGISFNGQRARSNNISVDGVDANGALNGNTRLTLSQEAVREFQVVTSQFAPEFGRAAGGLVNIVSRSGTNDFRGNAFLYVRDESMDARNAFVTEGKPQFERQNYGGTFGGPLKRNRTFFFGAVERMQRDESGVITISDSAVAAINAVLAARPIPNSGVTSIATGVYPITRRDTLVSFKLDHTLNANNTLAFRYTYGESNEGNAGGVGIGGLVAESGGGGQRNRDQSFLGTWTQVISPALLGELRVQVAPRDLTQYANDEVGPRVSISGVATWGRNTNFPVILDETTTQGSYTMSWQRGRHFVKFGGDIAHIASTSSFPVSFAGSFTFGSLATFTAGTPTTFTQGFGNPQIDLPDTMYAVFAQDSWSLSDRLTLVYGLRYDYDAQPQNVPRDRSNPIEAPLDDGIHRDGNNVSPRAGFTWDPIGGGRTLIRGGYGRFYDKVFLLVARNALLARQSISLSGANAAAQFREGAFPESDQLPPGFSLARPSINVSDPEMQIPYVDQVSLGVERQFGRDWSAAVNVVRNWGSDLLVSDNTNLGPPTVLTSANAPSLGVSNPTAQQLGRPYYGSTNRLDALFNNIQMVSSSGWSSYYGVQFTLEKRFSDGYSLRANYILSEAKDDGSDFTQAEQPNDPYNRAAERSYSAEHQRHRVTLSGVWELPYGRDDGAEGNPVLLGLFGGWTTSMTFTYRSGTAENHAVGSDVNGDGNSSPDRPFIDGVMADRNSYEGGDFAGVNLRMSRRLRFGGRRALLLQFEAFNLFNRTNYSGINMTWGTAVEPRSTFGTYTSASAPRQLQLGVKFEF